MTISVDIADRLYDYTDEEKAADAIALFQDEMGMSDDAIVALWSGPSDDRKRELETRVYAAIDANGSALRAKENIPAEISLLIN